MHHSDDYKLSAVEYYLNYGNASLRNTCYVFGCKKTSLARWINRYLSYGHVHNNSRKEGSYKVRKIHVDYIGKLVREKPDIFLWQILEKLNETFRLIISKSHLVNIIKYLNLTYKKFYQNHNPKTRFGKEINYRRSIKEFYDKIKLYNLSDIICIDETSIQIGISNTKGRILMGKRLYKNTTNNDIFKKYTLISAISNRKTEEYNLYKKGGIDTDRLIIFLTKLLIRKRNKLIILDNASAHRNQRIKDFIVNSGNDYLYILPYKHFLNPIEFYFNQLKYYIKQKEPMNYDKIKNSIKYAIRNIKKEHYENYFYNSYDKDKLKKKYKNTNRLRKSPKIYKE